MSEEDRVLYGELRSLLERPDIEAHVELERLTRQDALARDYVVRQLERAGLLWMWRASNLVATSGFLYADPHDAQLSMRELQEAGWPRAVVCRWGARCAQEACASQGFLNAKVHEILDVARAHSAVGSVAFEEGELRKAYTYAQGKMGRHDASSPEHHAWRALWFACSIRDDDWGWTQSIAAESARRAGVTIAQQRALMVDELVGWAEAQTQDD